MQKKFSKEIIADGIEFYSVKDDKFKHNRISVHLVLPLDKNTVTEYAILPFLMRKGYKGCEDFSKLNAMLDELYGASLIAEVGKFGANQVIILSIQAIDDRFALDDDKIIKRCTELLCNIVLDPAITEAGFPEKDLELERQFLIDTITAEINDKRAYAVNRCKLLMGETNPASIRKYGYVENAKAITTKSAEVAYHQMIDKATIKMMFVGSGNAETALAVLSARFGSLKRATEALAPIKYFDAPSKVQEIDEQMDVTQAKLVLGFRVPLVTDPLEKTAIKLMAILYGGTVSSKLFMNVREKLSLCYYCAARFDRMTGIMMVDSGVELPNVELAKNEIIKQLDDIKNAVITEDELKSGKLAIKNSLRSVTDSLGSVEEWYLVQSFLGTELNPTDEFALIDQITVEMVAKVAKKVTLDTIYLLSPNR